jgi:hypothetical protein
VDGLGLNGGAGAAMERPHAPLRIGLTGGIGSGKSTVAAMLARHGARLVDTDAIARELTAAGGAAIEAIRAHFGQFARLPQRRQRRQRSLRSTSIKWVWSGWRALSCQSRTCRRCRQTPQVAVSRCQFRRSLRRIAYLGPKFALCSGMPRA